MTGSPAVQIVCGLALAAAISGCIVRNIVEPRARLTGTCDGACDHYTACKPGHPATADARCRAECPGVFADAESITMFESLECRETVEFVDGAPSATGTQSSSRAP